MPVAEGEVAEAADLRVPRREGVDPARDLVEDVQEGAGTRGEGRDGDRGNLLVLDGGVYAEDEGPQLLWGGWRMGVRGLRWERRTGGGRGGEGTYREGARGEEAF